MVSKDISPGFVRFTDGVVSAMQWLTAVFGVSLVGISIWGFWLSRSLARSYCDPAYPAFKLVVMVLSWCVLFAPIGWLGISVLRSKLRQVQRSRISSPFETRTGPQILPPAAGHHVSTPSNVQPLDDATVRRLSELGERGARIFNVGAGVVLFLSGLLGFVVMWIDSRNPLSSPPSMRYGFFNFRFVTMVLVACGFAVLIGLAILRDSFKKADTSWLIPLRIFGAIVGRHAAVESRHASVERKNAGTEDLRRL